MFPSSGVRQMAVSSTSFCLVIGAVVTLILLLLHISSNASVSMVGERKLRFTKGVAEYVGLTKDDIGRDSKGKYGISIGINAKDKELVIFKSLKSKGRIVGGSLEHPEVYCADVCKNILKLMGKELVKEGTVNFAEAKEDTFNHDGILKLRVCITD